MPVALVRDTCRAVSFTGNPLLYKSEDELELECELGQSAGLEMTTGNKVQIDLLIRACTDQLFLRDGSWRLQFTVHCCSDEVAAHDVAEPGAAAKLVDIVAHKDVTISGDQPTMKISKKIKLRSEHTKICNKKITIELIPKSFLARYLWSWRGPSIVVPFV